MARKRREPDGEKPKRRGRARPAGGAWGDSPRFRAQEIVYQALDEDDEERRVALAQQALTIDPDCADAYVLLAEAAPSRKEALALYEQGVTAGERAIGPDDFRAMEGQFWGFHETRPYMRARLGLAEALWTAGRRDEAVRHLQEMLRLNPNDNQGVRYTLAAWLLFLDRDDELAELLARYPEEGSAAWAYTAALLAFRRHGDSVETRRLLKQAKKVNKYVPDYVLGREFPPEEMPPTYTPGARTEAIVYIDQFLAAWKFTPGAVAWMRAQEKTARRKADEPPPTGPTDAGKRTLKRLPAAGEAWQADFVQLGNWVEFAEGKVRPWLAVVAERDQGFVLGHDISPESPSPERLWDMLARAVQHPMAGRPHRPAELQVGADGRWEALRPHLDEIGVRLVTGAAVDRAAALLAQMNEHLGGPPLPGLLDVPGVTPEMAGDFFAAAAEFFRQSPWKKVGYESAIRVVSDRFADGPRYAVLMGQSGLTAGLALYDDLDSLRTILSGEFDRDENARMTVATGVTFGDESETPLADVAAARQHGWTVARADAYPSIFRTEGDGEPRSPTAEGLQLMTACLRAVPQFAARRRQDEPGEEVIVVPTAAGEARLTLSWVPEE